MLTAKNRIGKKRYMVLTVLSVGVAINYIDRAAMSVIVPFMSEDLGLTSTDVGWLLSAFFWSYVLFQLPGGYFTDKFGPKIVITLGSLFWGVATAVCGMVSGLAALLGARVVLGAAEAPIYPASASAVTHWFPKQERGFAVATFNNGSKIGGTLAIPLITFLLALVGWRWTFIIAGGVAVVFALIWHLYYKSPRSFKGLGAEELAHIESNQDKDISEPMKLGGLLKSRAVQAMMVGFFCVNFVSYFFFTWFPTYLIKTFNLSFVELGTLGMLPGVAAIIGGWGGGILSDSLVKKGYSITVARKAVLVGGMILSAAIGLAAYTPTVGLALTALCIANFGATFAAAALWVLPSDIAPNKGNIATIGGIQNMAANMAGVVSPILVGVLMQFTNSFVMPLLLAGAVGLLGALVYAFWLPEVKPLVVKNA